MLPKYHFCIGAVFTIALYFLFPQITVINLLIIFASNFFIDGDHYFYYFLREKNLNPIKCYNWYKRHVRQILSLPIEERKKTYSGFYFLHGIEWVIILFLLGNYVNTIFLYVSMGFLLHWVTDTPYEYKMKRTWDKLSLVYNSCKFRKLRKTQEI